MVPVASWVSVWSIRRPISSPGTKRPETRCVPINRCTNDFPMESPLFPCPSPCPLPIRLCRRPIVGRPGHRRRPQPPGADLAASLGRLHLRVLGEEPLVLPDVIRPFRRNVGFLEDGLNRTLRLTCPAIDALSGVDIQLVS